MPTKKKAVLTKDSAVKLVAYLKDYFDSHQINPEDSLAQMAESCGFTIKAKPVEERQRTRSYEAQVLTPNGGMLFSVMLLHRTKYEAQIADEGRGGGISDGDWWGYGCLYVVEDLANKLANFVSSKNGRGSRYWECYKAIADYAEAMPDDGTPTKGKGKKKT